MKTIRFATLAAAVLLAAVSAAGAQGRPQTGTLRVVVQDQTGGILPGALLQVKGIESATSQIALTDIAADPQGVATVRDLPAGKYSVTASFPGFEARVLPDVRVRAGENRREMTLAIQKLDENVSVGRDPSTSASDPNNSRFGNVLSKEQIEALPDDPDEMEKVLKEMAGPGATIRVDGFRGGKLPPKSQIRSIRFSSGMFAAENHAGGMTMVDISTAPGIGALRGGLDIGFRDDALNARNAFVPQKGPEQTQQYSINMSGTLRKDRTSFSLSAGGASLYDSANVFAATPDGARATPLRRPAERMNFTGRLDHAVSASHTLRAMYQQNDNDQRNLGVGSFDLSDRAYSRTTRDSMFRLSESGPITRTVFGETRLQLRWSSADTTSAIDAPTYRVFDAFTSGGAQQAGGRDGTEVEFASNIDWAFGRHSMRFGTLLEGGWFDSDSRTNYLGTYTFASLADYQAGRPATYTKRIGDPLVNYSHWQAGIFAQDDWRARKNLTLSGGVRAELQTHLDNRWNIAPRAGFAWSPFASGKTTVRGGGGIFYDWLEAQTFEQTLRVDGLRQQDLVIRNPGYPDPFAGDATQQVLPTSKYLLSPDLVMPERAMVNIGVSQQFGPRFMFNMNYNHTEGRNRFRGRNINAPLANGLRPDPAFGNVTQVESSAKMRGDTVNLGVNLNLPQRRTFLFANYALIRQRSDADGPFSLPADSYDTAAEWGPASGAPSYLFSTMFSTNVWNNVRLTLNGSMQSGTVYNVTTGHDDNGDTVFNDRPAGVGRNSERGKGTWDVGARLSYAFGFGERARATGAGGGPMVMQRVIVGGPGGGEGGMMAALGGASGADNKRLRIELYASAQNLFNHTNPIGYSGVMTSPFFGQPTAALPGRRIELGARFGL
jgi:carboxypeptidase family protein